MSYENMGPADIAAVTGNNNGGFGFGNGEGGWFWIIILFLFVFAGNGWGNGFGGGNAGAADNYVLASDFAQVERKIDGVYAGICDSTFALNNTINSGFAAAQNTMTQGFAGLNTGMVTQGYETRNAISGIGAQMAQCCCDIRSDLAGVNYNMANQANMLSRDVERGFCDTQYRDAQNTNALLQSGHADADRIIAKLDAMETARKDERIAQLQTDNAALKFQISQDGQSRWLYEQLGPKCPQAAYVVQPPQQVTFPTNCCGGVNYAAYGSGGCGC